MAMKDLIPFRARRRGSQVPAAREPVAYDPFLRLHDEIHRLFEHWLPDFRMPGAALAGASRTWGFMPDVDVRETRKEIEVTAELPGVDQKDLDVRLDGNTLVIRGEKREERSTQEGEWTHSERSYGSFLRSIPLGVEIDPEHVQATFKKGVLRITLPKRHAGDRDPGRIPVKAG